MAANDDLFDAQIRHEIAVRRWTAREVRETLAILDKANRELERKLSSKLVQGSSFQSQRFKKLQKDIRELRKSLFTQLRQVNKSGTLALGKAEQEFSKKILETVVPVELNYATVNASHLNSLITTTPFAGGANAARTLNQWWTNLEAADARRISEALNLGMAQGETVPQMVSRVRNVGGLTRANAEAVIRTGVNHAVNTSREAFFSANGGLMDALRWTSVLDGRTSAICRARDGHFAPPDNNPNAQVPEPKLQPPGARPPAHPSCRSLMTGVLSPQGVEQMMPQRPFVRDARTRKFREKDFRADAKAKLGEKRWKKMTVKQRNQAIKKTRMSWANENIGRVPASTTYDQWLRRQPTSFQNEVLGLKKARMFRKGLKMDQFVDRKGQELTLIQLRQRFPEFAGAK